MTIHERINCIVRHYARGKNTVLAAELGVSEGNIRGYIKGVVPKADFLEKIVRHYDVSAYWLLTGDGEMLRTSQPPTPAPPVNSVEPAVNAASADISVFVDRLLRQAEEIGYLKARLAQIESRNGAE